MAVALPAWEIVDPMQRDNLSDPPRAFTRTRDSEIERQPAIVRYPSADCMNKPRDAPVITRRRVFTIVS